MCLLPCALLPGVLLLYMAAIDGELRCRSESGDVTMSSAPPLEAGPGPEGRSRRSSFSMM